jgi:hypothetical protein
MSANPEKYAESLERDLEAVRARAAAWKQLAKISRHAAKMAMDRPGLLLANMMIHADRIPEELGIVAGECLAWAFAGLLQDHPEAPNYLDLIMKDSNGVSYVVTVQRPGGKTPSQLKDEAIVERDKLKNELETLIRNIGIDQCNKVFCDEPGCPKNNPRT